MDASKSYTALTDCSATAARQALVTHLLNRSESVDDFKTAFDDVTQKVLTESETDATEALDLADMALWKSLRCLADGSILLTSTELDPFKRQLCEVIGEAHGGGLQAPYPDLFKRWLSPDGLLLVRDTNYGRRWANILQNQLRNVQEWPSCDPKPISGIMRVSPLVLQHLVEEGLGVHGGDGNQILGRIRCVARGGGSLGRTGSC
jgi:hypothetical protein